MIRVVVAEDSVTMRRLLVEALESDPELRVVGEARDGLEAIELAKRLEPDLIVMDAYMPGVDGLEATKEIMVRSPRPIVIVSSASDSREVELSLSATRAGALLALPKPSGPGSADFDEQRRELVSMAKAMAGVRVVRHWRGGLVSRPGQPPPMAARPPERGTGIVAIAASTGGPAALQRILMDLPGDFPAPILVVQHIARGFVDGFVEWLGRSASMRVKRAAHGEPAAEHTVYAAPDGMHLGVSPEGRIVLADEPPILGFRPSATYLFRSAGRAYGAEASAVVLTGMGSDGIDGLRDLRAAGGRVIAQDEDTSVVFGMAHEAARAGLVDELLPVERIAARLRELTAEPADV